MDWRGEDYIAEVNRTVAQRVEAAAFYLVSRIRENISTSGTKVASEKSIGTGVIGQAGKTYRKGRRIYGATRSAPGGFPYKQTGRLRQSISQQHFPEELKSLVGTALSYGRFLELGTAKMAARPFLRRTLAEEQAKIVRMIVGDGQGTVTAI